jgi:hypothetical protein
MARLPDPKRKLRGACRTAKLSAILFGLALLAYGAAPAVTFRVTTGGMPPLETLTVGSLTLAVGFLLIILAFPVGRGSPAALWTTLLISAVILAGTITLTFVAGPRATAIFPALMAASTGATSALGLEALRSGRRISRLTRAT